MTPMSIFRRRKQSTDLLEVDDGARVGLRQPLKLARAQRCRVGRRFDVGDAFARRLELGLQRRQLFAFARRLRRARRQLGDALALGLDAVDRLDPPFSGNTLDTPPTSLVDAPAFGVAQRGTRVLELADELVGLGQRRLCLFRPRRRLARRFKTKKFSIENKMKHQLQRTEIGARACFVARARRAVGRRFGTLRPRQRLLQSLLGSRRRHLICWDD